MLQIRNISARKFMTILSSSAYYELIGMPGKSNSGKGKMRFLIISEAKMSGIMGRIIRVAIVLLLVTGLGAGTIRQVSLSGLTSNHAVVTVISTDYTSSDAGDVSGLQTSTDLNINSYSSTFPNVLSANRNLLPAFQNDIKTSFSLSILCSRLC